jgi:phytol kinase
MLLASFVSILLTLLLVPGSSLSPETSALSLGTCLVAALLSGVTAALVESVSPRGTDNLSVPLLTALVVFGSTM